MASLGPNELPRLRDQTYYRLLFGSFHQMCWEDGPGRVGSKYYTITVWHGNAFCIICPVCGETIGDQWSLDSIHKESVIRKRLLCHNGTSCAKHVNTYGEGTGQTEVGLIVNYQPIRERLKLPCNELCSVCDKGVLLFHIQSVTVPFWSNIILKL